MHRLFIAVDFPDEVRESLADMCYGVPAAKWVAKDQLHLTLRFIGDADDGLLADVSEILHDVNASGFSLTLKGVGYFPPRRKPNVLWAGIEPSEPLAFLRDSIEKLLGELGLPPEGRKFHPHVTLARLRPEAPLAKITAFLSSNNLFKAQNVPVGEFHLYSSVLMPAGPVHTVEQTYSLL
jgi:RNA 2',3'-cyclic 3'-phosphodiesterase